MEIIRLLINWCNVSTGFHQHEGNNDCLALQLNSPATPVTPAFQPTSWSAKDDRVLGTLNNKCCVSSSASAFWSSPISCSHAAETWWTGRNSSQRVRSSPPTNWRPWHSQHIKSGTLNWSELIPIRMSPGDANYRPTHGWRLIIVRGDKSDITEEWEETHK